MYTIKTNYTSNSSSMDGAQSYKFSTEACITEFGSTENGLRSREIETRQSTYGKNILSAGKKTPLIIKFLDQFKSLLALLLVVASVLAFLLGSYSDALILLIIVFANASLGFFQEYKSEQILSKLKTLIVEKAKVLRDGVKQEILASEIVPGDILLMEEGDKIPADARLLKVELFSTNEFALTGESMPKSKSIEPIEGTAGLAEKRNMIFMGTSVATGNAKALVVATGAQTEIGTIATLTTGILFQRSPLQAQIDRMAKRISWIALLITLLLALLSYSFGATILESLILGIAVASSCVPEGLPTQISIALSLGGARLAEAKAVIKRLSAVETLGAATVICTDKTGTLTQNEMTVLHLWTPDDEFHFSGIGYEGKGTITNDVGHVVSPVNEVVLSQALKTGYYASNATVHAPDKEHPSYYAIGDPTEAALIVATEKGDLALDQLDQFKELHELPFDSDRKRMTSIREVNDEERIAYVKGAPGDVLHLCTYIQTLSGIRPITEEDKNKILSKNNAYADQSLRVLMLAYRPLGLQDCVECSIENIEKELICTGLVAMMDPPRKEVPDAILNALSAHMRIVIITGDHPRTAKAIAHSIGLQHKADQPLSVYEGKEIEIISDTALQEILRQGNLIFSRVSSKDKLRIVSLLQNMGEVVAVTGDGVNDAPALKKADIGVAMGRTGTDVSKEASTIILLDDSFSTLVKAISEGRVIYANLRKIILTTLIGNSGELCTVLLGFIGMYYGYPAAIFAVQILAVDLLGEILPLTALAWDPPTHDILKDKPRNQNEQILSGQTLREVGLMGVLIGLFAVGNFYAYLYFTNNLGAPSMLQVGNETYHTATTVTYLTIIFCQFANILSRRVPEKFVLCKASFSNYRLLLSFVVTILAVLFITETPMIASLLYMHSVPFFGWILAVFGGILLLIFLEMKKAFIRVRKVSTIL